MRRFWKEEKQIPWITLDENPDLKSCLLHQWLQVINCCLARKARRVAASEALDAVLRQASSANEESYVSEATASPVSLLYAKSSTGELILRLGVYHQVENLTMLETGEPVYAPVTQVCNFLRSLLAIFISYVPSVNSYPCRRVRY